MIEWEGVAVEKLDPESVVREYDLKKYYNMKKKNYARNKYKVHC